MSAVMLAAIAELMVQGHSLLHACYS